MKQNLSDLAKAAAAAEAGESQLSSETIEKRLRKKRLAIVMLVLNVLALISFGVAVFADVSLLSLVAILLAVSSFVVSKVCKRI